MREIKCNEDGVVAVTLEALGLLNADEKVKEFGRLLEKANSIVEELTFGNTTLVVELRDVTCI